MPKENEQGYKVEEINKPTEEESEQKIKELSKFLEKAWNLPI